MRDEMLEEILAERIAEREALAEAQEHTAQEEQRLAARRKEASGEMKSSAAEYERALAVHADNWDAVAASSEELRRARERYTIARGAARALDAELIHVPDNAELARTNHDARDRWRAWQRAQRAGW